MRLCRELNISDAEAVGHLHYLWWWCLDNTPDGNLSDIPIEVIAEVAHWTTVGRGRKRDPELFLSALIKCQFIDNNTELNTNYLHNWDEYAGNLTNQRALTKEQRQLGGRNRMAKLSESERKLLAEKANNTRWASQHTSDKMPATVPNRTQPTVPTVPLTTTPLPPSPTEESLSSSEKQEEEGNEKTVYEVYEGEIGRITEAVRNTLVDAIDHFTSDWVRDAIKEASLRQHRSWPYIQKILENWATEGRDAGKQVAGPGDDPGRFQKGRLGHTVCTSAADLERLKAERDSLRDEPGFKTEEPP
jgi:DnaD/phage-associated family protein